MARLAILPSDDAMAADRGTGWQGEWCACIAGRALRAGDNDFDDLRRRRHQDLDKVRCRH